MKNIWEWLEISPTTDKAEIKKAYAKQSKKYHPEEHPEEFMQLRNAYKLALVAAGRGVDAAQKSSGLQETIDNSEEKQLREEQERREQQEREQWYEEVKSQAEEQWDEWDATEKQEVPENEDILEDENTSNEEEAFFYEFQEEEKLDQEQRRLYDAFLCGIQQLVISHYAADLLAWKMLFSWYKDKIDIHSKIVLDAAVLIFYPGCALPEYVWKFLYRQFFVYQRDPSIQQYVAKLDEARYRKLGPVWQRTRQLTLKDRLKQAIPLYGAAEKRNIAVFLFGNESPLYEDYSKKSLMGEKIGKALLIGGLILGMPLVYANEKSRKTEEERPSYNQTLYGNSKYFEEQNRENLEALKELNNAADKIYREYTKESPYKCMILDQDKKEVSACVYYDPAKVRFVIEMDRSDGTVETAYIADYFQDEDIEEQTNIFLKYIWKQDCRLKN